MVSWAEPATSRNEAAHTAPSSRPLARAVTPMTTASGSTPATRGSTSRAPAQPGRGDAGADCSTRAP